MLIKVSVCTYLTEDGVIRNAVSNQIKYSLPRLCFGTFRSIFLYVVASEAAVLSCAGATSAYMG